MANHLDWVRLTVWTSMLLACVAIWVAIVWAAVRFYRGY